MSSVIYSNRRDFLLIIEINLILWVFFFFRFLWFVSVSVCFIFLCQIQDKPWYYIKKLFSVDKHSVWGRIWHTK